MSKDKAREFWIQDLAEPTYRATDVSCYDEEVNPSIIDEWHVIEHSAYAALEAKLAECVAALEFYGDKQNHTMCFRPGINRCVSVNLDGTSEIEIDFGKRAREVLARVKK